MSMDRRWIAACLLLGCTGVTATTPGRDVDAGDPPGDGPPVASPEAPDAEPPPPPWASLIDLDHLHQIQITCPASEVSKIETLHGPYAFCTFVYDGQVLQSVGLQQKGSVYGGCRCLKLPPGATECANPKCRAPNYADK